MFDFFLILYFSCVKLLFSEKLDVVFVKNIIIMTNASMSLRSMFFKNDYQSNCWQKLNKNFYVIIFFTSNQNSSRNKICSTRDVVVWNEQKDINDQDFTNKSNHQDTRVKKKKNDRLKRAQLLFFILDVFVKENHLIYSYIQHVYSSFFSSFFNEFVEKNSQSNCNNSMIIWNEQKKFVFVLFDEIVNR